MNMTLAVIVCFFLAYANGANDNFKGVATLFGSKSTSYKQALVWATVTTLAGSFCAVYLARDLATAFNGRGLVSPEIAALPHFIIAVGLAAAVTVILATKFGFPISTTHAMVGGLVGAGLVAAPGGVNTHQLATSFFAPLLISPFLALVFAAFLFFIVQLFAHQNVPLQKSCVCVDESPTLSSASSAAAYVATAPQIVIGDSNACAQAGFISLIGFNPERIVNSLHFLSAGAVGFARGLNDTPKIAAILITFDSFSDAFAFSALVMALGGVISARRVAETMAHKITALTPQQGLAANLVTSCLVIGASKFGMPVSTTHVSCGSLFGIGSVSRTAQWRTIFSIVTAWITTLPVAALLGAGFFWLYGQSLKP